MRHRAKPTRSGEKIPLVYILSASHSGSTLLAMLLGSHPEVCTVGELKLTSMGDVDRYLCSCGKRIKECEFWTAINQDMSERGFEFDITNAGTDIRTGATAYTRWLLRPLHREPLLERFRDLALALSSAWRANLKQIQARNLALIESVMSRTGKRVIVDSSKIGIRLKYLLKNRGIEVKIIRLVRDGRAVALSYMDPAEFADASDPELRGGGTGGRRESERLSIKDGAYEWRRSNEEAEAILKSLGRSRWTEVHYEDLCEKTQETMERLFSFIGVEPRSGTLDFRSANHHVMGNGMRLDSTSQISLDERWRSTLSKEDLKVFDSVAGDLNRRLGYR